MPTLREAITKTFTRFAKRGDSGPPPVSAPAETTQDHLAQTPAPDHFEGKQVGAYRVLRKIGGGGMGHVYLALDTRLDRNVAVKVLSPDRVGDPVSALRMQQEAKTASALNHPNIVTIFEICEFEGLYCIVSEHVEGVVLRQLIEEGKLDIPKAVEIAMQIASALMAAHAAGVVHRDLKPSNVMVRTDRYVKLIDFGLAKQMPRVADETARYSLTRPGMVVGTVDYMSPEQARGLELDQRTDLWSLGVILYEMLTLHRPFEGPTEHHVMAAICDGKRQSLTSAPGIPAPLRRVLNRALSKNLEDRYQSAAELLADLERFQPRSRGISRLSHIHAHYPVTSRRWWLWPLAGLISIGCVLAWRTNFLERTVLAPHWLMMNPIRQLTFTGRIQIAAISPDGQYVAYSQGDPQGIQTLYLKQVDSPTEDAKIPSRRISYVGLTFSPDSHFLYEAEKDDSLVGKLYRVPILGARSEVPILTDIDGPVSFSPDGDRFAFVRRIPVPKPGQPSESRIEIARRDGSDRHTLLSRTDYTLERFAAWSAKGDTVAVILENYALPSQSAGEKLLDFVAVDGKETTMRLPEWRVTGQLFWTPDNRSVVLSSSDPTESRDRSQLRQVARKTGEYRDITKDLAGYRSATLTADGRRLAAVKSESTASVWVANASNLAQGQTMPTESEDQPSLAWLDETRLLINSKRNGFANLWAFDPESQSRSGLTNEPFVEQGAVAVPGSRSIIFSSNRTSPSHLWRFSPETNRLTQLTFGLTFDEQPDISRDGSWLVYTAWRGNVPRLERLDLVTGQISLAVPYQARYGKVAPDGARILCQMQDRATGNWSVATVFLKDLRNQQFWPQIGSLYRWSPDGKAVTAVHTDARGVSNIWAYPMDGSPARPLTHFYEQQIANFVWSPSGDRLAVIRVNTGANVMLFEEEKKR